MKTKNSKVISSQGQRNKDVLLTTFPESGSKNVGDKLITESAKKLIRFRVPEYKPEELFREDKFNHLEPKSIRTILAPGFSVNNETYPKLYGFHDKLPEIYNKIFVVGCSFQDTRAAQAIYDDYEYDEKTWTLLNQLSKSYGSIPCRDIPITEMLNKKKISASYIGDLALYDDDLVFTKMNLPNSIKTIVFTIQHKPKFYKQSEKLLKLIKREFPEAKLYAVHHSKPNIHSSKVAIMAKELGYHEVDISGNVDGLKFYDDIDLHIGYRLHGHVYFLRKRKPSLLIAEDSRAWGLARTKELKVGIFDGLDDSMDINYITPYNLMKFLRKEMKKEFSGYKPLFSFIDNTYKGIVRPYFDDFSQLLGWNKPFGYNFKPRIKRFMKYFPLKIK